MIVLPATEIKSDVSPFLEGEDSTLKQFHGIMTKEHGLCGSEGSARETETIFEPKVVVVSMNFVDDEDRILSCF